MKNVFVALLLLCISATITFAQWEQNARVMSATSNTKSVVFVATVPTTGTYTSTAFEFKDLGKYTMYFGTLCNSATAGVKISASIWGSFDGLAKDSLTTLYVDRTAETNLIDTLSLTGVKKYYPYYFIRLKGGSSGNAVDTRVQLSIYAIKD
jgi:hypothetical protein